MTERSHFWRRHLEAIDAEGVSTAAYARREGLALGLLYRKCVMKSVLLSRRHL